MYPHLLSPITIRGLELPNRIVYPAMGTKMATQDKFVTEQLIHYQLARVKGGSGLNFLEVASVYEPASPAKFVSVAHDRFLPMLTRFNDVLHAAGGKTGVQLWLGGVAVASDPTARILTPSPMPLSADYTVPAMTLDDIDAAVDAFGRAARRCVEAGFDTLEFHAAHGYTPHMFLSGALNQRDDEYGGSLENRARFLLRIIAAMRANVPADMPLFMRVDAQDDYLQGGLTTEEVIQFCSWAGEAGIDVLDVSRGNLFGPGLKYEVPSIDLPRGFNVASAARVKRETGMLTMAVGRINRGDQAEEILASGQADLVVMGRAQLADPEFVTKVSQGREDEIVYCIGCNQGCFDAFVDPAMPHITCLRNPSVGLEDEQRLKPTPEPKLVYVAGGGVGGMQAATLLHRRGHHPVLFEQTHELGGQFLLAGMAPRKAEMREAAIAMGRTLVKEGVEVRMHDQLTPEKLDGADALIVATGARPILPTFPGRDLPHVCDSHDVLSQTVFPSGNVVVVGGGLVGLEVAEYLVGKATSVTVLEMLGAVGEDIGQIRKISVMEELAAAGVRMIPGATCREITPSAVVYEHDGELAEVPYNSVVLAVGARSRPTQGLQDRAAQLGIPCYVIGDAKEARRAIQAIHEATEVALAIE
jgi:2,4-dienoyl-CoA reductase-like NADH-dependent reductase (Old Yellow Enzyme family)/thioredoxin reductase